jgi:hypothetical protein
MKIKARDQFLDNILLHTQNQASACLSILPKSTALTNIFNYISIYIVVHIFTRTIEALRYYQREGYN